MIEIHKPTEKNIVVIRAATGHELSNYEKWKLASIEPGAQENRIEAIRINDQRFQVNPSTKEAYINLGDLAFKNLITPEELSADELFFIKCELDTIPQEDTNE